MTADKFRYPEQAGEPLPLRWYETALVEPHEGSYRTLAAHGRAKDAIGYAGIVEARWNAAAKASLLDIVPGEDAAMRNLAAWIDSDTLARLRNPPMDEPPFAARRLEVVEITRHARGMLERAPSPVHSADLAEAEG